MKYKKVLPFLTALALVAASCSGSSSEEATDTTAGDAGSETTAADSGGSEKLEPEDDLVILCGLQEEWCEVATAAFQEETGINSSFLRLSSGEALTRLEAEADDPLFDVWFGGPSLGPVAAAEKGLVTPYVSDVADEIPDNLKSGDGIWTGIYLGALGFCSNVELLEELGVEAPTSYDDLLDPKFKDNIAIADQRTSGTAITASANIAAIRGSEQAALDYLKELDANIASYTKSGSAPGRMATQGEVATAIIFSHDCVQFELETGVDMEVTFPEEGTGYEVGQVSVINNAANPGSAQAFVDWALSAEGQSKATEADAFQISTNAGAETTEYTINLDEVPLHPDFTPQLAEDLRSGDFAERFALEVRGGADAPTE